MTSPTTDRLDVSIIGGSIGGLFAAALLHHDGHRVEVYEKSVRGLATRGAGLVAQQEIFTALDAAGLPANAVPGVTSTERITLDLHGRVGQREYAEQTQLSWDRLYDALRATVPEDRYHLDSGIASVDGDGGRARFEVGGREHETDVLIGADGAHSRVREFVAPDHHDDHYVGYAIWRGLVPESSVPGRAADTLFRRMTFYTGPGEHALGYLVPGPHGETEPGARRYNWVWYRSMTAAELSALTVSAGRSSDATSLAPGQTPGEVVASLTEQARRRLPPQFADVVELESRPFLQAVLDYVAPRLRRGRTVLLGDAAAVVRPHTAMGAAKAAGDALALASVLRQSSSTDAALAEYQALRLPVAREIARYGVMLGSRMPL